MAGPGNRAASTSGEVPEVSGSTVRASHGSRERPVFFLVLSSVLLLTVFLGFAPTFYLDPLFEVPNDVDPLPTFLVVHAIFLTAWFGGLVLQSGLIRRGRYDVHRAIGTIGVFVAAGVVFTGAVATLGLIGRDPSPRLATLATANSLNLLVFVPLVAVAIRMRSRPQVHKRLLLLASIAIVGPAVGPGRMLGSYLGSLLPDFVSVPVPLVFWIPLVAAMVVYDLASSGRVRAATAWGVTAKAVSVGITLAMVNSGAAIAYVDWLRSLALVG